MNDIDASGTTGWVSLILPDSGVRNEGFVPYNFDGVLDGNRHTISGLFSRRYGGSSSGRAGMFDTLGSTGIVRELSLASVDIAGTQVGGLAAGNDGLILGVSVTGDIDVFNHNFENTSGGGIVAQNSSGTIRGSIADVVITDVVDPSRMVIGPSESHFIGGIAGTSGGIVEQSRTSGDISYDEALVGYVGGIVGFNSGEVRDSYSDAAVTADTGSGTSAHVGSITGRNVGVIARTIARGPVSLIGGNLTGGVGAVTGTDDPSNTSLISSFFDVAGTGQTTSGQNGETTGFSPGFGTYFEGAIPNVEVVPGEPFVALDDAENFTSLAEQSGNWDFNAIWSIPDDGVDQARLYAVDPVITARDLPSGTPEVEYVGAALDFSAVSSDYSGGPADYLFGPLGDTGDLTVMDDQVILSGTDAGLQTYVWPDSYVSDLGQVYDVRSLAYPLLITPRQISLSLLEFDGTAPDKVYGETYGPSDVDLILSAAGSIPEDDAFATAFYSNPDSLVSDGLVATASVSGSPYPLAIDPATFTGGVFDNYAISLQPTTLAVTPRSLSITVNDADKVEGDTITFDGTEFTAAGLVNGDTVNSLTITSAGAPANASIEGSPYPIIGSNPVGSGLFNYTVTINNGTLTVFENVPSPMSLDIFLDNAVKTYGETLVFNGTEFTTVGLAAGDSVDSLTITSDGAAAGAPVSGSPYAILGSDPVGSGLDRYVITIVPGQLIILPRPLDIVVDDRTKTYGDEVFFDGTEFTTAGIIDGASVTSLTIASAGAAPTAGVAGSPYAITGSDPVGTGLENYVVTVVPGQLTVVPAPLTITADDQVKPFGAELTFTGTEFTVTGLLNADTVDSATLTSAGAAAGAPVTGAEGVAIVITDPLGTGLENYTITLVNGILVVAPGDLIITANDQTKVYGTAFTFDGTEFTVTGLAAGDSVDSVTLTSAGASETAQVGDGPFAIVASNAVGTGLEKYTLVFADGSLTVVPAPLTVTANDQTKQQGVAFTFAGTEFTATGLRNADSVDSATLTSAGAAAEALADDSPFAIVIGGVTGTGLENYEIATVDGSFFVNNAVTPPVINPIPPGSVGLPNPPDTIVIGFPGATSTASGPLGTGTGVQSRTQGPGGAQQSLPDAQSTFAYVDDVSTDLELAIQSCGNADQDFTNYMACLSESLDTYANALDEIVNDLPAGMETVSATIRTASSGVKAAAARAQRRLAGATTDAQRRAIRREAVAEARGAINEAREEIRKAISLIRADDPEVQAVQQQTGARIVQAFDTIDSELARAVEL